MSESTNTQSLDGLLKSENGRIVTGVLYDPYDYAANRKTAKGRALIGRRVALRMDKGQRAAGLAFPSFDGTPVGTRGTFELRYIPSPFSPSRMTVAAFYTK